MTILTNKRGTVTVKMKKKTGSVPELSKKPLLEHNRVKRYFLEDGEPVDFLVALGVQTPEGKVVKAKYHKFKQINRYLEMVEDILSSIDREDTIRIIDFGCGKSYLTFALYYYLKIKHNKDVEIIGLDLKKDVIEDCNRLKDRLGYRGLRFLQGDIRDYENTERVDMVVSLHACDTATDYAIAKAVGWDASVILTVPCCQHEVNRQIRCPQLDGVLQYSIIKERMSALITDAYRADCLEAVGYETQILEFIELEHTPKNLLIRAVKKGRETQKAVKMQGRYKEKENKQVSPKELEEYLHIQPLLGKLLTKE